ncbi:MAG: HD domain-containing phosphohydrolase [Acetobacterium sp.]
MSDNFYKKLIQESPIGYAYHKIICNDDGTPWDYEFIETNPAFEALTGLKDVAIIGKRISEILPDIRSSKFDWIDCYGAVALNGSKRELVQFSESLNKWYKINVYSPQKYYFITYFTDITNQNIMAENLFYISMHDDLTGVYNRRFYEEELTRLDTEENLPITLVLADINGLKLINDSFGNAIGDALLKRVAEVLENSCREDGVVARLGGDEFVIILPKTDVFEVVEIIKSLKALFLAEKVDAITPSISFGYETKEMIEENIQGVFKKAEDDMYRHKLYESSSTRSRTIDLIMNTLYAKSHREMLHSIRVSEICKVIAVKMKFDEDAVNQIKLSGLIHDIGKMGVDEKILNKPGILNHEEWSEIRKHPEIGYRILSSVNEFSEMANYILEHHERWDGKGYPKGLMGEEISLQGRIVGIADAYDAMTSDRTYRMGLSDFEAITEIKRCSGTQFDPEIAQLFIETVLLKELNHK